MTRFFSTLLVLLCLVSPPALAGKKISREPFTNYLATADLIIVDSFLGGSNYTTRVTALSNLFNIFGTAARSNAAAFIASSSGLGTNTTIRLLLMPGSNASSNYVWTCTNAATGQGEWRAASGAITTNGNQFLGVPLSIMDGALLTNLNVASLIAPIGVADLGTDSQRWRSFYVGDGGINFSSGGNVSDDGGALDFTALAGFFDGQLATAMNLVASLDCIVGGKFSGSGAGLTNLPVGYVGGHISTNNGTTDLFFPLGDDVATATSTGFVCTNGNLRLRPFWSGKGGTMDSMMIKVNTAVAAGTVRFGIYQRTDATNIYPGSLLFDAGLFDASTTGVKRTNLVSPIVLKPGTVYYVAVSANTNIQVATHSTGLAAAVLGCNTNLVSICALEAITTYGALQATCPLTNVIYQTDERYGACAAARFSLPY